jgi:hypothetical protein
MSAGGHLHDTVGGEAFRLLRVAVLGTWLIIVASASLAPAWEHLGWLFQPLGILRLLPEGFWTAWGTPVGVEVTRFLLIALLAAGILVRRPGALVLVPIALLVTFWTGFAGGFGAYLNHGRYALLYSTWIVALGAPLRGGDVTPARARGVLFASAFLLAVSYMLIGLNRFVVGGLEIFTGQALPVYMMIRTLEPGSFGFDFSYLLLRWAWVLPLLQVGFFVTTVAEVVSPLVLFHRRLRLAWLAVIVPFHLATLVTMNILFWENLVLIAVLLTAFPTHVERRWRAHREHRAALPGTGRGGAGMAAA